MKNKLYVGDCLTILDIIPEESIDLIYIDPPFYSQKAYEVFVNNGASRLAFEDRWRGGVNTFVEYLAKRITKLHRVLKPTGTFFVHLDWHIGHYVKVETDKIFGYHNFRNEIIWDYTFRLMDLPKFFNRKHDTIFFYGKTAKSHFKMPKVPWTREELILNRKQKIHIDENGDECIWMPGGKGHSKNKLKKIKDIIRGGKAVSDVWQIPIISSSAKERLGYPTQKPEPLLERIIEAGSKKNDLVLDAFCGCGTTMAVAEKLKRRWIGIDISQTAIQLVEKRLLKLGATFEMIGKAETLEELKKMSWQSFQTWAVNAVFGRHSPKKMADMGIDGFTYLDNNPIQVKQIESIGRPEIDKFVGVLDRVKTKKGMMIGIGFSRGAYEEAARLKREDDKHVELIECEKLLRGEYGYNILVS